MSPLQIQAAKCGPGWLVDPPRHSDEWTRYVKQSARTCALNLRLPRKQCMSGGIVRRFPDGTGSIRRIARLSPTCAQSRGYSSTPNIPASDLGHNRSRAAIFAGRPRNLRVTRRAFGPPAPARPSELCLRREWSRGLAASALPKAASACSASSFVGLWLLRCNDLVVRI